MQAMRILGGVVGGVLLIGTSISVLKTLVMPGGRIGRLYRTVGGGVDGMFRLAVHRVRGYEGRDRVLAFQAPVGLAGLLVSRRAADPVGFALGPWALRGGLVAAP